MNWSSGSPGALVIMRTRGNVDVASFLHRLVVVHAMDPCWRLKAAWRSLIAWSLSGLPGTRVLRPAGQDTPNARGKSRNFQILVENCVPKISCRSSPVLWSLVMRRIARSRNGWNGEVARPHVVDVSLVHAQSSVFEIPAAMGATTPWQKTEPVWKLAV